MTKKPYTKFGSLAHPGGALYFANVSGTKDILRETEQLIVQARVDLYKEALTVKGRKVTPEVEIALEELCRKRWDDFLLETAAKGVPEKLIVLLQLTRKANVVKYCKRLEMDDDDLSLLIYNCGQLGFTHQIKTRDFVPQHLQLSRDDVAQMKRGSSKAFLKKMSGMDSERKRVMVHLFDRKDEWHCLYFSWSDLQGGDAAHWRFGAHVHYVSHLWSNLQNTRLLDSFDKRTADIPGSLHIRFKSTDLPDPDYREDDPPSRS